MELEKCSAAFTRIQSEEVWLVVGIEARSYFGAPFEKDFCGTVEEGFLNPM